MVKSKTTELLFKVIKNISTKIICVTLRDHYGYSDDEIADIGAHDRLLLLIEFRALASAEVDIALHKMGGNETVRTQYLDLAISELMETGESEARMYEEIYADYGKLLALGDKLMSISEIHHSRISSILENGRLEITPPPQLAGEHIFLNRKKDQDLLLLLELSGKATVLCLSGKCSSVGDVLSCIYVTPSNSQSDKFSAKRIIFTALVALGLIIFIMEKVRLL